MLTSAVGDQITVNGLTSGQSQWYKVYATAGQWIYSCIYGIGSGHDWDLGMYNSSNSQITYSAKSGTTVEYIGYTVPTSGYYYFKVNAYSVSGTSSSCYFKVVLSNGTSGTSSTNSNYNREDAKYYLDEYWNSRNPSYADMSNLGGDCANFVSQAMKYSGMAMRGNASTRDLNTSWFMDIGLSSYTTSNYSSTWTAAGSFTTHWGTNSMGTGNKRAYECKYYIGQDIYDNFSTIKSSLKVGDVIQWTSNSATNRSHTLMVYEIASDDMLLAAHSSNTKSESLYDKADDNRNMMIVIIRVKSGS